MDTKPLEKLGLQAAEIKIYLDLLKNGLSTATDISRRTSINRSHTYDKLDILLEKGLISAVIKNNVKYFKAADPKKLVDYIDEIKKNMEDIVPDLDKLKISQKEKTTVELYQGKEGIKTVIKDALRVKKDYCVFGEEGKFQELFPVFIKQLLRDVVHYRMHERLLSKESKRKKILMTSKNSKIKYLPDKFFSPTMTVVYGTKVAIFIWSEPLFAILIKDKDVARSFQNYFDILWEVAKK